MVNLLFSGVHWKGCWTMMNCHKVDKLQYSITLFDLPAHEE